MSYIAVVVIIITAIVGVKVIKMYTQKKWGSSTVQDDENQH